MIALKRKNENSMKKNVLFSILFSSALLTGILVCLICDLAISGGLTWSPVSVVSIVFAWVISFPSMILEKRGILASCLAFSVFIVPYLFLLSCFLKVRAVFSIGTAMAVVSIVFLWLVTGVLYRVGKGRKFIAFGIVSLLVIPLNLTVNIVLSKMIEQPILDGWDILSIFVLLVLAFVFFLCDYAKRKRRVVRNQ